MRIQRAEIHPGIRIDKISVEGGAGLLFTIGILALFLVGLPATRWFLALSLTLGGIIGAVLRLTSRD